MKNKKQYITELQKQLKSLSTIQKAKASERYFPHGVNCLGVNAVDIKSIIIDFHKNNIDLDPAEILDITEQFLKVAVYNEEVLLAFGLLNKLSKQHFDDSLLLRFEYWLGHYVENWSQCDDLCMKTIYQFMLSRPHLIESVQQWSFSTNPWLRRASNVVWVKFIKRKMGKNTYYLNKQLVFQNCDLLLEDSDEFVQKSVGWLLKVTAAHHQDDVVQYLYDNHTTMWRHTIRYAIEKMEPDLRKQILSLKHNKQ
ncbi:MAG: DNA alkylation repair protein [Saccharospirillaceae bacterium]|nr:DNA alkylation repair protein [Pseudomonadales bacterium]NRB77540.1 DNA alkylation repair protein [Saccharospirillaceae bacterium]